MVTHSYSLFVVVVVVIRQKEGTTTMVGQEVPCLVVYPPSRFALVLGFAKKYIFFVTCPGFLRCVSCPSRLSVRSQSAGFPLSLGSAGV